MPLNKIVVPTQAVLRVARPTDNLAELTRMYIDGLGFQLLGEFVDHQGFNGSIIGHPQHPYHFEFTHHQGAQVGRAPTQDNLLVFYVPDADAWNALSENLLRAGFMHVTSYNPYWDTAGRTFEDIDGYRIVLQHREWTL